MVYIDRKLLESNKLIGGMEILILEPLNREQLLWRGDVKASRGIADYS